MMTARRTALPTTAYSHRHGEWEQAPLRSYHAYRYEDIFNGVDTRRARQVCPQVLWPVARRKLDQLNRVRELHELRQPPDNRLEKLRGDRAGQHSIRVNDQYRVCFRWKDGHAHEVEIADYH
jgi:proteic killer suppression protein